MKLMDSSQLTHGADILTDILMNSILDPLNIEDERSVIIREMQEVNKSPEEVLFDDLHSAVCLVFIIC